MMGWTRESPEVEKGRDQGELRRNKCGKTGKKGLKGACV